MKSGLKTLAASLLVVLSMTLVAVLAGATETNDQSLTAQIQTALIAQPTGRTQCEHRPLDVKPLSAAIDSVASFAQGIKGAFVGRVINRAQCMACGCSDGSLNVVEVVASENNLKAAQLNGWSVLDARLVRKVSNGDLAQTILPVPAPAL